MKRMKMCWGKRELESFWTSKNPQNLLMIWCKGTRNILMKFPWYPHGAYNSGGKISAMKSAFFFLSNPNHLRCLVNLNMVPSYLFIQSFSPKAEGEGKAQLKNVGFKVRVLRKQGGARGGGGGEMLGHHMLSCLWCLHWPTSVLWIDNQKVIVI